ncbi:hypothetical protein [Streptomyces sp. NPDC002324]
MSVVAVTLDPDFVYLVGRLLPLVGEVLPEAGGAVQACLTMTHNRLRDALQ